MNEAKDRVVSTLEAFGGDSLRDAWLFDDATRESLFLRPDVEDAIEPVDVEKYIDIERYGYVTRETYEDLHYTSYGYTVRGFSAYDQFRTFLEDGGVRIGLLASFDRVEGGHDWAALDDRLQRLLREHPIGAFEPA